jgi:hypothetical protein
LVSYRRQLVQGLAGLQQPDRSAVWTMIAHFRASVENLDSDLLEATMDIWLMAVEPYPAWAIKRAVANFVRGHTATPSNGAFAPKPPQLAQECEAVMAPFRKNLRRIDNVLDADRDEEVTTPEQREKNLAMLETLKAELTKSVDPRDPRAKRDLNVREISPEERLAQIAADPSYKQHVIGHGLRSKLAYENIDKHCQPSRPEPEEP